jgi:TatD DNase family protein
MENAFKVLVQHPSIKAVGETGLDYYRNYCPIPQQHRVLEKQMDLAYTTDLPLVIHCREAHQDLLKKCEEVSRQRGAFKGVIHCFSGTPEEAERYVDLGFYLSFAGPLTYKKSEALRAALRRTPLHRILVETDCPYLAPQSHRGKRNEPAYVKMTAERAAQELDLSFKDFGELVTQNAKELFRLPEEPV